MQSSTFYRTFAASPGETLSGTYRSVGGGGNTSLGGDVMVVDARSITFDSAGRFESASTKGGSGPNSVTGATSQNAGSYRLNGHTIEMRYADGRSVTTGFYFFPAKGQKNHRRDWHWRQRILTQKVATVAVLGAPQSSSPASSPGNNTSVNPNCVRSRMRVGYRRPIRWSHSCCTTRA